MAANSFSNKDGSSYGNFPADFFAKSDKSLLSAYMAEPFCTARLIADSAEFEFAASMFFDALVTDNIFKSAGDSAFL